MTSTLAKLIVHAGLPKCGTSSLQNLFSTENHRVPKELGMIWIGQGLKPWSKGAAATEIMYRKDASIAAIEALQPLPHATYFISSEALCSNTDVLDALARR
ncbi:hypothetical protein, partial [Salipiger aestuarii]|uniref:hypothetical protein n=1 Tax=Salipiger aestuarii TaxID=568098 RepID=UPI00123AD72F